MSIQTLPDPQQTMGAAAHNLRFDPVSRVSGDLAFHASADFGSRTVGNAVAMARTFRGYENLLAGRDARDAVFVSSRACGVCGVAHSICSAMAVEAACGVQPPPMGIVARNFLSATECMIDHPSHLFLRAGPDYSEPVVRRTSPELWTRAEATPAPHAGVHGFSTMSQIMAELTRYSGWLYREALHMTRMAREANVIVGGKYPHPQTITPGGVSSTVDATDFNLTLLRVVKFFDYSRRVVAVWDDLTNFFYSADARYAEVGQGPMNFLDLGLWEDPHATSSILTSPGEHRWSKPGAIVDGVLQTADLREIDAGVEEYVRHSFYDEWGGGTPVLDAAGNALPPRHPANKQTLPQPGSSDPNGRYSWSTAARWRGHAMETGAQARMWATALSGAGSHGGFVESTGRGVQMSVPSGQMPAGVLEWQIPGRWNAFERNRARAYAFAQATLMCYENVVMGLDIARRGGTDVRIFTPYKIPKDGIAGTGQWGGARGYVSHHVLIDGRVIDNYQIVGPSTFSGSPRDDAGRPGPCEAAVEATPLVSSDPTQQGIDVLRTIRSFDLCMYCASH